MFVVKNVNMPSIGDSISQGNVLQLLKKQGDYVNLDQVIANIQTDKVTVQIKTPFAGQLTKLYAKQGQTVIVGKPFFDVQTDAKKPAQSEKPIQKKQQIKKPSEAPSPKKQQPSKKQQPKKKQQQKKTQSKKAKPPTMSFESSSQGERSQKREPLSRLRQKIAQRLKNAQNTSALLTTFQQVDMSGVMQIRKQLGQQFLQKHGVKLGFNSFFIKAAVAGIKENPIINSVIDKNEVIHRSYIDVSIAVATPSGLMVPVIRNCHRIGFAEIQKDIIRLAKKGRDGKINLEDMSGGTFTISNGGVFGSLMGTPIINPPQSAILGLHAIINRPVVRGDQIVARPMMYLALTYDHRLLDGKDSALFLKKIQGQIENPHRLLLEL